jgi:hypothetical protein
MSREWITHVPLLIEWIQKHETIIWWVGSLSLVTLLGFLILIPVIVIKLPAEYFQKKTIPSEHDIKGLSFTRLMFVIFKNIFGVMLVLAGVVMLFLPGQGIITLLIGISLVSLPGKHKLVLKIVSQKTVWHSLNRFRAKFHRPAFRMPQ